MRRREAIRLQALLVLVVRRRRERRERVQQPSTTGDVASWRDGVARRRHGGEWRVAVCVGRGLEGAWWWHLLLSVEGGGEGLREDCLVASWAGASAAVVAVSVSVTAAAARRGRAIGGLVGCGATGAGRGSADADGARADAAGGLETEGGGSEGGGVDGGHPDAGLVDFEEVGDERVEVDVGVGEVVEGELLPVPLVITLA